MNQQPILLRTRGVEPVRRVVPATPPTGAPDVALVSRPRLTLRLGEAAERPLTVVSAPAGSGKTLAVQAWAAEAPEPLVWVRVSQPDLAGSGLWGLVMEELHHYGLRFTGPHPGPGSLAYDRVFLFSLATQLARRQGPLVLVVDCECRLPSSVGAGLHYLVQHAAGQVRLVLLTREEPPLPLWRYRLAGALSELHASDLAFTADEARDLLAGYDVALAPDAFTALMQQTRGWAVGLALAARSLASSPEPDDAVARLRGDAGEVADYLLTQVLDAHSAAVRRVMLRTSVVDLLRPGLVAALAGSRAPRTLSALVRGNALLEPDRAAPGSFRYHPMLRQLLRSRLDAELPGQTAELDRTASAWLAQNGLLDEAVSRAADAGRWADAAGYVVDGLALGELLQPPAASALGSSLAELPDTVAGAPAALVRSALALARDDLPAAEEQLAHADKLSGPTPAASLRLASELVRLRLAIRADDPAAVVRRAADVDQALCLQDECRLAEHPEIAATVSSARGSALVALGDLDSAADVLTIQAPPAPGPRVARLVAGCLGQAALVAAWRGELRKAVELADRARAVSDAPDAEVALAWVSAERYDFGGPQSRLLRTPHASRLPDGPLARAMLALARSRARRARGHLDQALTELLDPRLQDLPGWLKDQLRVEAAAVHLAAGNHRKATAVVGLAHAQAAEARLVRARAAIADGGSPPGLEELAAAPGTVTARVAGWLVVTESLLGSGKERQATDALARSLRLAAPESLRRPFAEAPTPVRRLLRSQRELRGKHPWLGDTTPPAVPTQRAADPPAMVEELTEREREVLGLLADLLSTEEIAGALFVSVNTVRTHVRSILRKLGATRRNDAIRRARALQILPTEPTHVGITRYG